MSEANSSPDTAWWTLQGYEAIHQLRRGTCYAIRKEAGFYQVDPEGMAQAVEVIGSFHGDGGVVINLTNSSPSAVV